MQCFYCSNLFTFTRCFLLTFAFSFILGHLDGNQLTGSISTEIGSLQNLNELWLDHNGLTGTIPFQLLDMVSLQKLVLNNNDLTGTLPDNFNFDHRTTSHNHLNVLQLSSNRLTGSLPPSLFQQNYLALILSNNLLTGTIPSQFCAQVKHFKLDTSPWFVDQPQIDCSCCNAAQSYIWTADKGIDEDDNDGSRMMTHPACPSKHIYNVTFYERYWIQDFIADVTIHQVKGQEDFFTSSVCLSPTGCYQVYDENDLTLYLSYSASQNSLVSTNNKNTNRCQSVNICNQAIGAGHPKRKGLNHLTQTMFSDLSILDDSSSPEYNALCWIMTQDNLYDDHSIEDGTLIQRFIMAMFYYSQERPEEISSNTFTCDWNGVKCDANKKFIQELNFSDQSFSGTIISDIGFLTRLQKIDFSHNQFSGTIPSLMFSQLTQLEVLDVSHNLLQGNIAKELLRIPTLRAVNMSQNTFVGTLPDDFLYSQNLGE